MQSSVRVTRMSPGSAALVGPDSNSDNPLKNIEHLIVGTLRYDDDDDRSRPCCSRLLLLHRVLSLWSCDPYQSGLLPILPSSPASLSTSKPWGGLWAEVSDLVLCFSSPWWSQQCPMLLLAVGMSWKSQCPVLCPHLWPHKNNKI